MEKKDKTKKGKIDDTEAIKRLLVFIVSSMEGVTQEDIAKILGIDRTSVGRSFHLHDGKSKKLKKNHI